MKQLFLILLLLVSLALADSSKLQKFQVKFVITYNELTLEQAAEKEKEIKKYFKDCEIKVKVEDANLIPTGIHLYYPNNNMPLPVNPLFYYDNNMIMPYYPDSENLLFKLDSLSQKGSLK